MQIRETAQLLDMVPRVDHASMAAWTTVRRDVMAEEDLGDGVVLANNTPADTQEESEEALDLQRKSSRPPNPRSSTEPIPSVLVHGGCNDKWQQDDSSSPRPNNSHPRNRSPYSRSHLRTRSSGAALLSAPPMTRAHSMPNPHISRPLDPNSTTPASLSPSPIPTRPRSPFKEDRSYHPLRSPSWLESNNMSASGGSIAIEAIQEDSELDITPRAHSAQSAFSSPHSHSSSRSTSLHRRRPTSPLHSIAGAAQPGAPIHKSASFPASVVDHNAPINMDSTPSGSNSPALGPQRYNEAYPSLHHYASSSSFSIGSSMPSTPTSARSRSPSISSLDTIEDAPEEESEAIESERMERLKLAAERAEQGEASDSDDGGTGTVRRRNGSLDVPRGFGFRGSGGSRERKRWSICGGERRGDLDLETIWED